VYDVIYRWAYVTGRKVIEERKKVGQDDGEDLVRRLIFDIRGEDLPGRFLDKLSSRLAEYKTNVGLDLDVSPHRRIYERKLWGNHFFYVKSAVISGLTNSLVKESWE
jgi:hypothetical protein